MAMSTNVKTSERKLRVKNKDFDAMFTASLMNAAHRHLQEYGTIIGVCEDSANTIDLKVESANCLRRWTSGFLDECKEFRITPPHIFSIRAPFVDTFYSTIIQDRTLKMYIVFFS